FEGALDNDLAHGLAFTTVRQLFSSGGTFKHQFLIQMNPPLAPAGRSHDKPWLRRLFVAFWPEADCATAYSKAKPPKAIPAGHHVSVRFVKSRSGSHPLLSPTPAATLPLLISELDESILLYALGRPTFEEDPVTHVKTLRQSLSPADV